MKQTIQFISYLQKQNLTENAIKSRMSKANKAEEILKKDFDSIVVDNQTMYDSLVLLNKCDSSHNAMQNVLRKYYKFINNKEFPRLKNF